MENLKDIMTTLIDLYARSDNELDELIRHNSTLSVDDLNQHAELYRQICDTIRDISINDYHTSISERTAIILGTIEARADYMAKCTIFQLSYIHNQEA